MLRYNKLAFSRLEQNHNSILHYVVLFCATKCFALLQRAHEWDTSSDWNNTSFNNAFNAKNINSVEPRSLLASMLETSHEQAVAVSSQIDSELQSTSLAVRNILLHQATFEAGELFEIVKRAFDTYKRLRVRHLVILQLLVSQSLDLFTLNVCFFSGDSNASQHASVKLATLVNLWAHHINVQYSISLYLFSLRDTNKYSA